MPIFFSFNCSATTELYTLSLHDALPIFSANLGVLPVFADSNPGTGLNSGSGFGGALVFSLSWPLDRKSTRLNSSHITISYAVFCLKKKTTQAGKSILAH